MVEDRVFVIGDLLRRNARPIQVCHKLTELLLRPKDRGRRLRVNTYAHLKPAVLPDTHVILAAAVSCAET